MAPTKPPMARCAIALATFLAQLQPALASFWTITSYRVVTETTTKLLDSCTEDCRSFTYTRTIGLAPRVTPAAAATSSSTSTDSYDDVEVVYMYIPGDELAESDFITTTPLNVYTSFIIPVTYTAAATCPTPFSFVTTSRVYLPYLVQPHVTGTSSTSSRYSGLGDEYTIVTQFLAPTDVPESMIDTTTDYYNNYYAKRCRNPTATAHVPSPTGDRGSDDFDPPDFFPPGYDEGPDFDGLKGVGVAVAAWVIAVAVILPSIFLLGFVESYCWFRRMMLGKSALRLGTICWCALSLWFILLTRKSPSRSPEDQVLLRQYWNTLSAGTRFKLWLKWGFRWKYPVELLGNPDGNNPPVTVVAAAPPGQPMYAPAPDNAASSGPDGGAEKTHINQEQQQQQQPQVPMQASMPYPGQQPPHMQPMPGASYPQPYPPPPVYPHPPQGYVMPPMSPAQGAYNMGMGQPGVSPTTPPPGPDGQQQHWQSMYQPYVPSPSPAQTNVTGDVPLQSTTPPGAAPDQQHPR